MLRYRDHRASGCHVPDTSRSQRFWQSHSQIPSVLGIPFSYYCSADPPEPSRDAQIPSVLVIPSKKILDFAGKSKTFSERWIPLNIEVFSSILN